MTANISTGSPQRGLGRAGWVLYAIVGTGEVVSQLIGFHPGVATGLLVAMPVLLLVMTSTPLRLGRERPVPVGWWWVAAAVTASWVGDINGQMTTKLICFAIAHGAFIAAFWPYRYGVVGRGTVRLATTIICAAGLVVTGARVLIPSAGTLWPAILGYSILVGAMAVFATGLGELAGLGGLCFIVSDLLVGWHMLHGAADHWHGAAAMALYLVAQAAIVAAIIGGRPAVPKIMTPNESSTVNKPDRELSRQTRSDDANADWTYEAGVNKVGDPSATSAVRWRRVDLDALLDQAIDRQVPTEPIHAVIDLYEQHAHDHSLTPDEQNTLETMIIAARAASTEGKPGCGRWLIQMRGETTASRGNGRGAASRPVEAITMNYSATATGRC